MVIGEFTSVQERGLTLNWYRMVWLYRSPLSVGRRAGSNLLVQIIFTCRRGAYRKRGRGQRPKGRVNEIYIYIGRGRREPGDGERYGALLKFGSTVYVWRTFCIFDNAQNWRIAPPKNKSLCNQTL